MAAPSPIPDVFSHVVYTDAEKDAIQQWLATAAQLASPSEERLASLNSHLATHTTLLGSKPSAADIAVYRALAPHVAKWTSAERTGERGYHHIVRHVDFVQNASVFKVPIDPADVKFSIKPQVERRKTKKGPEAPPHLLAYQDELAALSRVNEALKAASKQAHVAQVAANRLASGDSPAYEAELAAKEQAYAAELAAKVRACKADLAALQQAHQAKLAEPSTKKEKNDKTKQAKPLSPAVLDLRVGHILKATTHPNADSLFVSTIAVGDAPGADHTTEHDGRTVRTVCSGLNGLVPLAEMQGRAVVAVCNLKPVTMRGVKSAAMVLAASPRAPADDSAHHGPVELVDPPPGAQPGDRVFFDGWAGDPEPVLNPKKKAWETVQPGFCTTDALEAAFDPTAVPALADRPGIAKLRTDKGACTVKSLKGATIR